jgi:predicted site-specific integrase-resolvase
LLVRRVNAKESTARQGISYATIRRWFEAGKLRAPACRLDRNGASVDRVAGGAGGGSAFHGHREDYLAMLRDPEVTTLVVKHRDRVARFSAGYVEAALAAQSRRLLVVGHFGIDGDLMRDLTEVRTLLFTRSYGRRTAAGRARWAIDAVTGAGGCP